MPKKEWQLLARDLGFYLTGHCDVEQAAWQRDEWLYPLDWGYQFDRPQDYFAPMDEAGVPLRDLPAQLGRTYLPSRVAAYALASWNRMRDRKRADSAAPEHRRAGFLAAAGWFAAQPGGAMRHDFALIGMAPGWLSCIAQGEAISTLVRAHRLTGAGSFAEAAVQAAGWLGKPVTEGGLRDRLPDGQPFLEEYPGTRYRHVLNGCLYALVGLDDLVRAGFDRDGRYAALRDDVLQAVDDHVRRWEVRGWTTYDFQSDDMAAIGAPANPNTMTYQTLHWILLDYLGRRSRRARLIAVADEWRLRSASLPRRAGALIGKLRFRFSHGYGVD